MANPFPALLGFFLAVSSSFQRFLVGNKNDKVKDYHAAGREGLFFWRRGGRAGISNREERVARKGSSLVPPKKELFSLGCPFAYGCEKGRFSAVDGSARERGYDHMKRLKLQTRRDFVQLRIHLSVFCRVLPSSGLHYCLEIWWVEDDSRLWVVKPWLEPRNRTEFEVLGANIAKVHSSHSLFQ